MTAQGSGRLAGRRIVITGAARGMGLATAEIFAAEGASLALCDRIVTMEHGRIVGDALHG